MRVVLGVAITYVILVFAVWLISLGLNMMWNCWLVSAGIYILFGL